MEEENPVFSTFLFAGIVSVFFSWATFSIPLVGMWGPPTIFGLSLATAINSSIKKLRYRNIIRIVVGSQIIWFTSILVTGFSVRVFGIYSFIPYTIGAGFGALMISVGLLFILDVLHPQRMLVVLTCLCAALATLPLASYLFTNPPALLVIGFCMTSWQMGYLITIPLIRNWCGIRVELPQEFEQEQLPEDAS